MSDFQKSMENAITDAQVAIINKTADEVRIKFNLNGLDSFVLRVDRNEKDGTLAYCLCNWYGGYKANVNMMSNNKGLTAWTYFFDTKVTKRLYFADMNVEGIEEYKAEVAEEVAE